MYGVTVAPDIAVRIDTYEHEGNWIKAIEAFVI